MRVPGSWWAASAAEMEQYGCACVPGPASEQALLVLLTKKVAVVAIPPPPTMRSTWARAPGTHSAESATTSAHAPFADGFNVDVALTFPSRGAGRAHLTASP